MYVEDPVGASHFLIVSRYHENNIKRYYHLLWVWVINIGIGVHHGIHSVIRPINA